MLPTVRKHIVADVLSSYRELTHNIAQLSLAELYYALELEGDTQRRPSAIERLIKRIVSLESSNLRDKLRRKYNGSQAL